MDPKTFSEIAALLTTFATITVAVSVLIYKLGARDDGGPIAPYAKRLGFEGKPPLACQGAFEGSPAQVEIDAQDGAIWLMVGVEQPPTFAIKRDGLLGMLDRVRGAAVPSGDPKFDGRFVVTTTGSRFRAADALDGELKGLVKKLFDRFGVTQLDTEYQPFLYQEKHHFGSKRILRARVPRLRPEHAAQVLEALDLLARHLEGVPIKVIRLGVERRASRSQTGKARCAYCHEDVTGSEPDLVACDGCGTVLHEGCWAEGGSCPTLGCGGQTPERAREPGATA